MLWSLTRSRGHEPGRGFVKRAGPLAPTVPRRQPRPVSQGRRRYCCEVHRLKPDLILEQADVLMWGIYINTTLEIAHTEHCDVTCVQIKP